MRASVTLFAVWLAVGVQAVRAELRATAAASPTAIAQMSHAAESSSEIWSEVSANAPELTLNVGGAPRGDHSPAVGVNPISGLPEATWCYWDGSDTEIAWSRFNGNSWSAPELITTNAVDDEAPSIAFDVDGATAIAWESRTAITRIEYRERQNSGAWSPVIHVSDGDADAGNPHVVQHQGRIKVGYIQPKSGSSRAVTVASDQFDPNPWPSRFTPELIAMISFSGDIAPELHSYPNQLFTTWVNSSNEIGFARFDGNTWQAPQTENYTSTEDLPKARIRAKIRALHSP